MVINLTPHDINVHIPEGVFTIPSSGQVARVSASYKGAGRAVHVIGDCPWDEPEAARPYGVPVPLVRGNYGEVTNLPEPHPDTIYIVSAMVRAARPDRNDLASPADLVRDERGNIIGCRSLEVS